MDLAADASAAPETTGVSSLVDTEIAPILTSIVFDRSGGHKYCLETVLIVTGYLSAEEQKSLHHVPLYNYKIPVFTSEVVAFLFAIYGFNSGYFTTHRGAPPFQIAVAANACPCDRALFKQISACPVIATSANGLLQAIASSKATSIIHGCCIHSHQFLRRETEKKFWSVQAAIVRALREKRGLVTLWVFIHPSCDRTLAFGFRRAVQRTG